MTTRSVSRRAAACLLLGPITFWLSGCDLFTSDPHRTGFYLVNRTSAPVDVTYLRGDKRIAIADELPPGDSLMVNQFVVGQECVSDTMIATDQAGGVIATFPGPICDQTTWEIAASQPTP